MIIHYLLNTFLHRYSNLALKLSWGTGTWMFTMVPGFWLGCQENSVSLAVYVIELIIGPALQVCWERSWYSTELAWVKKMMNIFILLSIYFHGFLSNWIVRERVSGLYLIVFSSLFFWVFLPFHASSYPWCLYSLDLFTFSSPHFLSFFLFFGLIFKIQPYQKGFKIC